MRISLKQGFTVVELVVVIVVIAILVSLTAVTYNVIRDRSYDKTVETDLKSIAAAFDAYKGAEGIYPGTSSELRNMSSKVPEASFSVTKDSYDTESSVITSDGRAENLVICSLSKSKYGIAAMSKSGHVLTYKSSDSDKSRQGVVEVDRYPWKNGIKNMCYKVLDSTLFAVFGYVGEAYYSRTTSNADLNSGWGNWRNGGMDQLQAY